MDKKSYSVDELLQYAYKYNTIPDVLFAKDTDGRNVYASKIESAIKSGEEKSILGKTDINIQYDKELGKMFYEQDMEIIKTGKPMHYPQRLQQWKQSYPVMRKVAGLRKSSLPRLINTRTLKN